MPRMVCSSLGSPGQSSLARSRLIATSTTLVLQSKLMSQTSSVIAVFDTICDWRRASTDSSVNSRALRSSRRVPRIARRDSRSMRRSPTVSCDGSLWRPRRVSTFRRASSSRKENGLAR